MLTGNRAEGRAASGPAAAPAAAEGSGWASLVPSWPLIIALVAYLRALAAPHALLNDPDTYLHIAAGRWMLAHHVLPTADPFSFTFPGAAWHPSEWLGEIFLAALYRAGGWSAVVVATAACFALALGLLGHFLCRRLDGLPAAIAALAGLALVLPHLVARAHVFALPLLVLWAGLLFAARDAGERPPWRALAVIPVWANLHASVLFGLAMAGFLAGEAVLYAGSGRSRGDRALSWGGFVAAAVALSLLTPNGIEGWLQPFRLMAMPALQSSFGEWLPPDLAQFPALEIYLLGLIALGFWLRASVPATRLVLLLALVHMALSHVRHADVLGLVAPLALAAALAPALRQLLAGETNSAVWRGAARLSRPARPAAIVVALGLGLAAAAPLLVRPLLRGDDVATPASALAAAGALGLSGPVFNSEEFGGYLVFAGVPDFIDGRIEMYGNDFLAADVPAERGDATALQGILAHYRISWTLLAPQAGAVAAMDRLPGWRRAYSDRFAVIHVRDTAAEP